VHRITILNHIKKEFIQDGGHKKAYITKKLVIHLLVNGLICLILSGSGFNCVSNMRKVLILFSMALILCPIGCGRLGSKASEIIQGCL